MKLTADAVNNLLRRVLFTDDESIGDDAVKAEGIMHTYAFHPARIKDAAPEIAELLAELPDEFHADKGGGWSFLNACVDRHGNHWAEHPTMERLFCLGIGAGLASWLMPRDVWRLLPGGMPYVQVKAQGSAP